MYIAHNLMAANTARNLNAHYANLATSTQRLSSGLRINSAADDSAGLAIRELQRAECAALNQGARNVNDAISMLQVTDGALGIIDEKLIRLRELSEQAATGTYNSTQRLMIDSEFQAMGEGIDRIARSTDFNGIKLLDGGSLARIDLNTPIIYNTNTINVEIENNVRNILYHHVPQGAYIGNQVDQIKKTTNSQETIITEYYYDNNELYKKTIRETNKVIEKEHNIIDTDLFFSAPTLDRYGWDYFYTRFIDENSIETYKNFIKNQPIQNIDVTSNIVTSAVYKFDDGPQPFNPIFDTIGNHRHIFTFDLNQDGHDDLEFNYYGKHTNKLDRFISFNFYGSRLTTSQLPNEYQNYTSTTIEKIDPDKIDPIKIHFGPMNDSAEDYYYIEKRDCTSKGLGIDNLSIETQEKAQNALVEIDKAIEKKDKARGYYGSMQNRLENTATNLTTQSENLQAAESRISDADIAQEMTNFVKKQILAQSAVAILSQANSLKQIVMQLIQ